MKKSSLAILFLTLVCSWPVQAAWQPKNALAILLAAKVSGTPIRVLVHDTLCDSASARPLAQEVGIQ